MSCTRPALMQPWLAREGAKPDVIRFPAMHPIHALSNDIKRSVRQRVVDMFNDRAKGERPVQRSADALFGQDSVIWRVHGDVGTMMTGGIASLLMQMLHPAVLAGVWDHSHFREDMQGRLRRTARFIAITTYGDRAQAKRAIERVRAVHGFVTGQMPDGRPYRADDPSLLAWVHVVEAYSFLKAWIRYGEPMMRVADQDRYFTEIAVIGETMGADPVPVPSAKPRRSSRICGQTWPSMPERKKYHA